MRTCIGCRRRASKADLVRLVAEPGGRIVLDPTGHAPGRGAYVCLNVGCLELAVRKGRVGRALRAAVEAAELEGLVREAQEEFIAWQR